MILIVAVDDRNGMMFNHRRQSQDRVMREKILSFVNGGHLWMNTYSSRQFLGYGSEKNIVVDDNFLEKAGRDDYCFAEDVLPDISAVDRLILFKWNRKYPGDFYFDLDISSWRLIESSDFEGTSHERITMEVYVRE